MMITRYSYYVDYYDYCNSYCNSYYYDHSAISYCQYPHSTMFLILHSIQRYKVVGCQYCFVFGIRIR